MQLDGFSFIANVIRPKTFIQCTRNRFVVLSLFHVLFSI